MRPLRLAPLLVALVAASVAGCGDDGGEPNLSNDHASCVEAVDGEVTITAEDLAWDTSCLGAPRGALKIVVDNRDDGVNHNLHLVDAPGEPETDLEPGPVRQELTVDLDPGRYEFVCDLHPNMVGTLIVADANPG